LEGLPLKEKSVKTGVKERVTGYREESIRMGKRGGELKRVEL